ncbi:alpha-L-fucosidase-like [Bacillus rossius redtenbacheri]|uniref:alpha-L-fucosidase-like n=1 Tax=Bacillus rossius redtenbacheri TaxID=93214 RepID=UPI002FDEC6F7
MNLVYLNTVKMSALTSLSVLILLGSTCGCTGTTYNATWASLDTRPLPEWYDDAKFGIFIHWGVYSVPSFGSEWFWNRWANNYTDYVEFMKKNYRPGFTYQEFAKDFTAEFFDPNDWAEIFENAGARYVVLTTKHHEGYTLWPSKYSFSWNSKDVGPSRDLVGEFTKAIRYTNIRLGLYHSLFEFYNPLYLLDKANDEKTHLFPDRKTIPEMYELVNTYKPDIFWSDGGIGSSDDYWKSREFIAWLYNESPVKDDIVVNDRWGDDAMCHHGDFYTCADRYNPGTLQAHKWENCMTIDQVSWGFRRNARLSDILSTAELISSLVTTVSTGGNLLLNVGPTKDGMITPIFEERLQDIGKWLKINGEAIYSSRPWTTQRDTVTSDVWYTQNKNSTAVYATALSWPKGRKLVLGAPSLLNNATVHLLGHSTALKWAAVANGIQITFPSKEDVSSQWAWTVKLTNVQKK